MTLGDRGLTPLTGRPTTLDHSGARRPRPDLLTGRPSTLMTFVNARKPRLGLSSGRLSTLNKTSVVLVDRGSTLWLPAPLH